VFHCLGFHVDVVGWNPENLGDFRLHLGKVRQQLGALREDIRVDVPDFVTLLADKVGSFAKELKTGHALEAIIGIRKHFADISQPARAEQRIRYRMTENIAVGMSDQAFFVGNFNPAQNERGRWSEPMEIETDANSKFHRVVFSSSRKARANVRSVGLVILMLRSDPRTIATAWFILSTRLDSSVP